MNGKTSATVKNRYRDKTFDRVEFLVKKGQKQVIKDFAETKGLSLNAYINKLINDDLGNSSD